MKIDFQQRMNSFLPRRGFSLVEVVLAIGVVSFALVAVIGIFGGIMKSSDDNTQRRELAEAVDALRRELREVDFTSAYNWVRDGSTLYYLTYHTATNGVPKPDSAQVVGQWFESSQLTNLAALEEARSGRWVRARLAVSPSNPGGNHASCRPVRLLAGCSARLGENGRGDNTEPINDQFRSSGSDPPCSAMRISKTTHGCRTERGFTIVELLVAAAVSMLLVVLLLAAAQGITGNYSRTRARVLQAGDASLALDQIVQDVEGMVVPNYASGEGLRIARDPSQPSGLTNAMWLSLLTSATDTDDSSVPFQGASRAVSYRLAHQNPVDATTIVPPAYALYRAIASATHTFRNIGTNITNQQSQYWNSLPAAPSPAPHSPTDRDNFLAENVVDFQVRFLRADNNQWTQPGQDVRIGRNGSTVDGQTVEGGFVRAEVSITVLTSEGAQRVQEGVFTVEEAAERFGRTSVRQTSVF